MSIEDQVKLIFTERGFIPREHSVKNIIGKYIQPCLPHVTAIGTSGGKTFTTAARLEFLYSTNRIKENQKTLILAADKSILRSNFVDSFSSFFENKSASFTYRGINNREELRKAMDDRIQVIITLPQTIFETSLLTELSHYEWEWLIQDEAHKWYFKNTVQSIIRILNPTYQSLLTGTPFKFNMENYKSNEPKFSIEYTSVREMYQLGYLSDFTAHVLHSNVELKKIDYVSILGNLKKDKKIGKLELENAFNEVVVGIIKKLKIPMKNLVTINNVTNNLTSVFGELKKTIIFTHGIHEANCLSAYLKINGVNSVVTHSQRNEDSNDVFNLFKDNKDVKVLVAVNQGKEGFDFPDLYNVIDMTYSYNFEVVMQMIGRILRKSKSIKNKHFFKVAPKHNASYLVSWMNALFMLFDKEWYSRFDGKNGFDIPVFRETTRSNNRSSSSNQESARRSSQTSPVYTNLDKFLSLEFMEKNSYFKLNDSLSTVAITTLGEVVRKLSCVKPLDQLKLELLDTSNENNKNISSPKNMINPNKYLESLKKEEETVKKGLSLSELKKIIMK